MLVIIHKHDWGMRRQRDDTIRGLFMNETKNRRAVPVDGLFNSANYYTLNSCFIGLNCESMSLNFFYAAAINDDVDVLSSYSLEYIMNHARFSIVYYDLPGLLRQIPTLTLLTLCRTPSQISLLHRQGGWLEMSRIFELQV